MAWQDFTQVTVLPLAGDNEASAAPTDTASADLVSAATNTGGIIITAANLTMRSNNVSDYVRLLIDGVIQMEIRQHPSTADGSLNSSGGLCAIEVPPGVAVSYSAFKNGASVYMGAVRIAWRHK